MKPVRVSTMAGVAALALACEGRVQELPPHGEALFIVDTDLPVPSLASRLRVDLYSESGVWFDSRDIGRSDERDWPASFGVYSDDDTRARRVLVRLRAYADGIVRDYAGERFAERTQHVAPHVPATIEELCRNAPALPFGTRLTLRSGRTMLTDQIPYRSCGHNRGGSVAARVDVAKAGAYRFSVANLVPFESPVTLFLRSQCEVPESQVACRYEPAASVVSSGHLARFDATLEPGTYWLMTGSNCSDWPADITLEALALDADDTPELPPLVTPTAPQSGPSTASLAGPRLVRNAQGSARDETPASEPLPSATVDRLVAVRLEPGKRGTVHVTLRGECAGTMAKLGADPTHVDLASAETCTDREAVRVPVVDTPLYAAAGSMASQTGTFVQSSPCSRDDDTADVACIPGGAFLLGGRALDPYVSTRAEPAPERLAKISRFYLDKHEVSVARLRAAAGRGFVLDPSRVHFNEHPFEVLGVLTSEQTQRYCTFSAGAFDREDLPVTCITWSYARDFCRAQGGDLPTEAQWEYAASAAGRPARTLFPWGDERPTCDRATFRNAPEQLTNAPSRCLPASDGGAIATGGPRSVRAHDGSDGVPGDVTPQGVVGLAGNVAEWVKDSGESYRSACWGAATVQDPECFEEPAPFNITRGGHWLGDVFPVFTRPFTMAGGALGGEPQLGALMQVGFRCAYAERPR